MSSALRHGDREPVTSLVIHDMPGGTLKANVAHNLWDWGLQRIQYRSLPRDLNYDLTGAEACSQNRDLPVSSFRHSLL